MKNSVKRRRQRTVDRALSEDQRRVARAAQIVLATWNTPSARATVAATVRRLIRDHCPRIEPIDAFGLTASAVGAFFERDHCLRGRRVSLPELAKFYQGSALIATHATIDEARAIGLAPRLLVPVAEHVDYSTSWFVKWSVEVMHEAIDVFRAPRFGTGATPRQHELYRAACTLNDMTVVGAEVLVGDVRAARRAVARRSHMHPREAAEFENAASVLGDMSLMLAQQHPLELLFRDNQGLLRFAKLQVRDTLMHEERRRPGAENREQEAAAEADALEAIPALDRVEHADLIERVSALLTRAPLRSRTGAVRRIVIDHYVRLRTGSETIGELARATGLSKSALSEAATTLDSELRTMLKASA